MRWLRYLREDMSVDFVAEDFASYVGVLLVDLTSMSRIPLSNRCIEDLSSAWDHLFNHRRGMVPTNNCDPSSPARGNEVEFGCDQDEAHWRVGWYTH